LFGNDIAIWDVGSYQKSSVELNLYRCYWSTMYRYGWHRLQAVVING